jgi:amidase
MNGRRGARWRAIPVVAVLCACSTTPSPGATAAPSATAVPSATAGSDATPIPGIPSQPAAPSVPFPMDATIPELQAAMESGDLTAVELVDFYLARIAAYEDAGPALNAFIVLNPAARDEAAALDAERAISGPRGLLHGIPIVLKDNIDTADMQTTAGARGLEGFIPPDDAFQVQKLRAAGAIILGKTNMEEFANGFRAASSIGGQTLSPYNLEREPGGSSGGSAVAVTSNFAVAGWGTDSCGSVRLPAVLNDLYGLRPSEGLTSRTGLIPLSTTLDTMAPMARSVVDLAIVLDATAGVDPADPTTVPVQASYLEAVDPNGLAGKRIGVRHFRLGTDLDALMRVALNDMVANGAEIVDVSMPREPDVGPIFSEFFTAFDEYLAARPNAPIRTLQELVDLNTEDPQWQEMLQGELGVSASDLAARERALEGRAAFRDEVVALMDELDLDAIFYPASNQTSPLLAGSAHPYDCASAGYGGFPAISIPAGFAANGLPVGFELMGRPFAEETLISLAAGYEAHTNHRVPPPETPPL